MVGSGGVGLAVALEQSVQAADLIVHPPKLKWSHDGLFQSLDHAAIRRGYEVSYIFKKILSSRKKLLWPYG